MAKLLNEPNVMWPDNSAGSLPNTGIVPVREIAEKSLRHSYQFLSVELFGHSRGVGVMINNLIAHAGKSRRSGIPYPVHLYRRRFAGKQEQS